MPLAEAEARLTERLDELAARADVDEPVAAFARDPHPRLDAVERLLGDPRFDPQRYRVAVAAVHRDALLAVWLPRLRTLYTTDPRLAQPIPLAERPARLAVIREHVHALEFEDERHIVAAERLGTRIDRRPDADPAVLFASTMLAGGARVAAT